MWTAFKIYIEFVTTYVSVLCLGFLALKHVSLSSPTRDRTRPHPPACIGSEVLTIGPPEKSHSVAV